MLYWYCTVLYWWCGANGGREGCGGWWVVEGVDVLAAAGMGGDVPVRGRDGRRDDETARGWDRWIVGSQAFRGRCCAVCCLALLPV